MTTYRKAVESIYVRTKKKRKIIKQNLLDSQKRKRGKRVRGGLTWVKRER